MLDSWLGRYSIVGLTRMEGLFMLACLALLRIHSYCPNFCYEHYEMDCQFHIVRFPLWALLNFQNHPNLRPILNSLPLLMIIFAKHCLLFLGAVSPILQPSSSPKHLSLREALDSILLAQRLHRISINFQRLYHNMSLLDGQLVGVKPCPAVSLISMNICISYTASDVHIKEPGTAKPLSTLSTEFDWAEYLDFSQEETESSNRPILTEESRLPSFEDATHDFESEDYRTERNEIVQSAQQPMYPISLSSSQSALAAVNSGDHELNCTAQNPDSSTNSTTVNKSNTPHFVEIEEHHDLDGLAGLFGLTLEEAHQGVRRLVKKKQVEACHSLGFLFAVDLI